MEEDVKIKIVSYNKFVCNWTDEKKLLFAKKLLEHRLKKLDVVIFIAAVQYNIKCKDIAEGLGISLSSVRRRLAKIRQRFPQLRCFNKNLPTNIPKRYSKTFGERNYRGANKEVSGMKSFDENNDRVIKKF